MNERDIIVDHKKMYRLFETDHAQLVIGAMSGGIGMYEVKVQLTDEDKHAYAQEGRSYLERLALKIQRDPESFRARWLP